MLTQCASVAPESLVSSISSTPPIDAATAALSAEEKSTPYVALADSATAPRQFFVALADDGVVDRALHARLLLACGCSTLCFQDAADLLEDFYSFISVGGSPNIYADALLLDYDMPRCTGGEATDRLRKAGYAGPIVVCTSNPHVEEHCMAVGATLVLRKPLSLLVLKDMLAALPPSLCTETPRSIAVTTARGASQQIFPLAVHSGGQRRRGGVCSSSSSSSSTSIAALAAIRAELAATTEALRRAHADIEARDVVFAAVQAERAREQQQQQQRLDGDHSRTGPSEGGEVPPTDTYAEATAAPSLGETAEELLAVREQLDSTTAALEDALQARAAEASASSAVSRKLREETAASESAALRRAHSVAASAVALGGSVATLAAIRMKLESTTDALAEVQLALEAAAEAEEEIMQEAGEAPVAMEGGSPLDRLQRQLLGQQEEHLRARREKRLLRTESGRREGDGVAREEGGGSAFVAPVEVELVSVAGQQSRGENSREDGGGMERVERERDCPPSGCVG